MEMGMPIYNEPNMNGELNSYYYYQCYQHVVQFIIIMQNSIVKVTNKTPLAFGNCCEIQLRHNNNIASL